MALELPLGTERLTLRAYREGDAEGSLSYYAREDVARLLLDEPWDIELANQRVAERIPRTDMRGPTGSLALVVERDGETIGDMAMWYTNPEWTCAEIGWVFDPRYGGQGYATEAAKCLVDLAFDHYGVHRLVAQMDARNGASARLAERVGLIKEAHHRQNWWSKGQWTDTLVFALLGSDPRTSPSNP